MKSMTISFLSLALLGACSAQSTDSASAENAVSTITANSKVAKHGDFAERPEIRTVKPGPAVRIETELREAVVPGGTGALNVTLTEGYRAGTLIVRASTSDGLTLITTNNETSFDLASGNSHDWTVFFDAPEAGRHYVNFYVRVETPFGALSRKSAAIVQVGKDTGNTASAKSVAPVETNADGDLIVVMEAQETIIQEE